MFNGRVYLYITTILTMVTTGKESTLAARARLGGRMNWLLVVRNSTL